MSITLLFLVALSFAECVPFSAWARHHGKTYATLAERLHREAVYAGNMATLEVELGPGVVPSVFADLTRQEFGARLLPRRGPVDLRSVAPVFIEGPAAAPANGSFLWTDHGAVTYVRDQGSAGTCWAESTTGNIEGQHFLAGNNLTALSVEQIVECDAEKDPAKDRADCGVFGGWPYLAYQYVIGAGGLVSERTLPYCAGGGNKTVPVCFPCVPSGWNDTLCGPPPSYCDKAYKSCNILPQDQIAPITSWVAISEDEDVIAEQLRTRGPLSVCLNAQELQFYGGGVWHPRSCPAAGLDHCVLLVGYGTAKGVLGQEEKVWILKNSWSAKWGVTPQGGKTGDNRGYFYLLRGKGMCGINTQVTSAIV
jgi:cathepsin F